MADNKSKWKDPTVNRVFLVGNVVGSPNIINQGLNTYAFLTLRTRVAEADASNNWVEQVIDVPVMTTDSKKASVIERFVKENRQLIIEGYYKSWTVDGVTSHAINITAMKLGNSNAPRATTNNNGVPALPVGP